MFAIEITMIDTADVLKPFSDALLYYKKNSVEDNVTHFGVSLTSTGEFDPENTLILPVEVEVDYKPVGAFGGNTSLVITYQAPNDNSEWMVGMLCSLSASCDFTVMVTDIETDETYVVAAFSPSTMRLIAS